MSDKEATNTAPIAYVTVQLATTMDAEAKKYSEKKRSKNQKKLLTDQLKHVLSLTTVQLLRVKYCTNSVIMERMIVPSTPNQLGWVRVSEVIYKKNLHICWTHGILNE